MRDQVGPYRILGEMGEGGTAVVYRAIQESVRRVVALKVLPEALSGDQSAVRRFRQEAEVAANLKHPNIVKVWDAHLEEPPYYFAMEFMGAGSLHDRIRQKSLSLEEIRSIFAQICLAMDHAHEQKIIHRDVKPANILFDPDGRPVLIDFGILRIQDTARMTVAGMKIGTPHYMSPEQARGLDPDRRADLYSCAVIMYEMLAGHTPFSEGDDGAPTSVLYKVVHEAPPPLESTRFALPDGVDEVMAKALAKAPKDRFADGASMAAAFSEALEGASERQVAQAAPPPAASAPEDSAPEPASPEPSLQTKSRPEPSTGPPADSKGPETTSPPLTLSRIEGRKQGIAAFAGLAVILIAAAALSHSLGLIPLSDASFAEPDEPPVVQNADGAVETETPATGVPVAEMPDFVGKAVDEVRAWCEQQAPAITCETQLQDDPKKDIVIAQDPAPGTIWSKGPITVTIGRGVTVPDLVGNTRTEAEAALKQAGFVWASRGEDATDAQLLVGEQSPAAGERLSKGDAVLLTLQAAVTVPEVTGKGPDGGRKEAEAAGLAWHVKATEDLTDPATQRLAVVSQSPAAGSTVLPGAVLYVREGVEVKVPAVVASGTQKARATLEGLGFTVGIAYQNTSGTGGVLKGQKPTAGTFAPRGSTVTLTVTRHVRTRSTPVRRHRTTPSSASGGNQSGGGGGSGDAGPTPF